MDHLAGIVFLLPQKLPLPLLVVLARPWLDLGHLVSGQLNVKLSGIYHGTFGLAPSLTPPLLLMSGGGICTPPADPWLLWGGSCPLAVISFTSCSMMFLAACSLLASSSSRSCYMKMLVWTEDSVLSDLFDDERMMDKGVLSKLILVSEMRYEVFLPHKGSQ